MLSICPPRLAFGFLVALVVTAIPLPSAAQGVPEVVREVLEQADRQREDGRLPEAEASYREAIRLGPQVVESYLALGALRLEASDLEGSLQVFESGLAAVPSPPDVRLAFNAAVVAWRLERFETGLGHVDMALRGSADDPDLNALRSAILAGLGRNDEALESVERALRRRKNDPQLLLRQGNLLHTLGRPEDAITAYEKAIRRNSDLLQASYNLGAVLFELERDEEALMAYERALVPTEQAFARGESVDPIHARAFANLGAIHVRAARWQDAVESYGKALQLTPDSADVLYNLGYAQYQLGRDAGAYESYVAALAHDADLPLAYLHLAKIHRRRGECSAAVARLETGLPMLGQASRPEALHTLGACRLELGQTAEAERHYRELLSLDGDDPVALVALGRLLRRDERREEAEALLAKARQQRPEDDRVALELVSLARARGDRQREQTLYEEILDRRADGPYELPVRLRLTLLLLRAGDTDTARPHLDRLVELTEGGGSASAEERGLVATLDGLDQLRRGELDGGREALARAETAGFEPAAQALELLAVRSGRATPSTDALAGDGATARANRGQLAWLAGRGEAARDDLRAASSSLGDWPSLHAALGDLDARRGRWSAAANHLERATELCDGATPSVPEASADGRFQALLDGDSNALCRWIASRHAEVAVAAALTDLSSGTAGARSARRRADRALGFDLGITERATALYVRGTAALLVGESESARSDLQTALDGGLAPALRPLAQTNLAVVESRSGRHAQARDLLQTVVRSSGASSPAGSAARLDLGILLEEHLGQPKEALAHYEAYLAGPTPRRATEVRQWVERLRRLYP